MYCCIVDATDLVRSAITNGDLDFSIKADFNDNNLMSFEIEDSSNYPSLSIGYLDPTSCIIDPTMVGYVDANGTDESLLGREKTHHYEEAVQDLVWINPLSFNLRTEFYGYVLPVKGSIMTMDFMMEYNSKSYIDTGVGWGWVHNHQIRMGSDPSTGDLLLRGGSGTIHRFPKISDNPLEFDHADYTWLKPVYWVEVDGEEEYHWIRLYHIEGNYVDFLGDGIDFVPMKTCDPYGRYYYYNWTIDGKLDSVKTDYTSRQINFMYNGPGGRLSNIYDTTSNPREIEIVYSEVFGAVGCYVISEIYKNGRLEHFYDYTSKGELILVDSQEEMFEYRPKDTGYLLRSPIKSYKIPECVEESGGNDADNPTTADLYKHWEYSDPVVCQELIDTDGDGIEDDPNPMFSKCCDDVYRAQHPDECGTEDDCDPDDPETEPKSECDDPTTEEEERCKCCCCDCLTFLHKTIQNCGGKQVIQVKFDKTLDNAQVTNEGNCKNTIINAQDPGGAESFCHICDDLKFQYDQYGLLNNDESSIAGEYWEQLGYDVKRSTIWYNDYNSVIITIAKETEKKQTYGGGSSPPKTVFSEDLEYNKRTAEPWPQELVKYTNSDGVEVNYEYDAQYPFRLRYMRSKNGTREVEYFWNSDGSLQKVELHHPDNSIETFQYEYDSDGRLTKILLASDKYIEIEYDTRWRIKHENYSGKKHVWYLYNNFDQLTKKTTSGDDQVVFRTESYTYDSNDNLASYNIVDSQNGYNDTTNYTYSDLGWLTEVSNNQGEFGKLKYDIYGNVLELDTIQPNDFYYEYDDKGRVESLLYYKDSPDFIYHNTWDGGQLLSREYGNGSIVFQEYDDYGRLKKVTDQNGYSVETIYSTDNDKYKRIVGFVDENGNRVDYEYDTEDRLILVKDHATGDTIQQFVYDDINSKITYIDADNNSIVVKYNVFDKIDYVIDSKGKAWNYMYDPMNGDFIGKSDPLNRVTTYTWDDGMHTGIAWPSQTEQIQKTYDDNGRLTSYTDPDGDITTYTYDSIEKYISSVLHSDQSMDQYVQTSNGVDATDSLGSYSFNYTTYDNFEVPSSISLPTGWTTSYSYNNHNLSSYTNNIGTYNLVFGADGLSSFNPPELTTPIYFDYDFNGRVTDCNITTNSNKTLSHEFIYDDDHNISDIDIVFDSTPFSDFEYTYSDIDEIIQTTYNDGLNQYTKTCQYDSMSQLTQSVSNGTTINYTYDDVYNLTTIYDGSTTQLFTYNDRDQLVSYNDGFDTWTITYNKTGEMVSKLNGTTNDEWTYSYNDYGQMKNAELPDGTDIEFNYYITGSRAKKKVTYPDNSTKTWTYFYDDGYLVRISCDDGTVIDYTFVDGQLYTITYGGSTYFPVSNIHGDVVTIIDGNGNVSASYEYDDWGKILSVNNSGNIPNQLLYQGSFGTIYDPEINMYGTIFRHYDPQICRFVSMDTDHGTFLQTITQNLYIYGSNNPLLNYDLTGFSPSRRKYRRYSSAEYCKQRCWTWQEAFAHELFKDDLCHFAYNWEVSEMIDNKIEKGLNVGEGDKNDRHIAFSVAYYNSALGMGLRTVDDCASFANILKTMTNMAFGTGVEVLQEFDGDTKDYWKKLKDKGYITEVFYDYIMNEDFYSDGFEWRRLWSAMAITAAWTFCWAGLDVPAFHVPEKVASGKLKHSLFDGNNNVPGSEFSGEWYDATKDFFKRFIGIKKGGMIDYGDSSTRTPLLNRIFKVYLHGGYYDDSNKFVNLWINGRNGTPIVIDHDGFKDIEDSSWYKNDREARWNNKPYVRARRLKREKDREENEEPASELEPIP